MSRLSIAVAVALASGCGAGSETGKDEGAAWGERLDCAVDGGFVETPAHGDAIPYALRCVVDDARNVWACTSANLYLDDGADLSDFTAIRFYCDRGTDVFIVRWL